MVITLTGFIPFSVKGLLEALHSLGSATFKNHVNSILNFKIAKDEA
jgi:hypothetical protein